MLESFRLSYGEVIAMRRLPDRAHDQDQNVNTTPTMTTTERDPREEYFQSTSVATSDQVSPRNDNTPNSSVCTMTSVNVMRQQYGTRTYGQCPSNSFQQSNTGSIEETTDVTDRRTENNPSNEYTSAYGTIDIHAHSLMADSLALFPNVPSHYEMNRHVMDGMES